MDQVYQTKAVTSSAGLKTSTTALAANSARLGWVIQNQAAAILFLKFGTGCSTTDYDLTLKAGTGAADGTAGSTSQMEGIVFTGIISVAAVGTPSYSVSEFAP